MERREKDENIVDSIKASPKGLATLEAHLYCKHNPLFSFSLISPTARHIVSDSRF